MAVSSSPSVPRSSPPKRSFDVAFLTGIGDSSASEEDPKEEVTPSSKVSKGFEESPAPKTPSPASVEDFSGYKSPRALSRDEKRSYGSAFTKVFRSQISSASPSGGSRFDGLPSLPSHWPPTSAPFMSSLLAGNKSFSPLIGGSPFLPHALAPLLTPSSTAQETLVEEYLKSQHQIFTSKAARGDISTSEALSRLRSSIPSPSDSYKLPFGGLPYHLGGITSPAKLTSPFLPQSPVSALISPTMTPLALSAQNVCAKCNISFRMTSDLVYHMRSQHKKEPDLFKKRRNEKLKCPICGETFRERHHLTRHMTAHQDRAEEEEPK
ncbi:UNVERIFIED_CONTAM: hypothetical protein GTU68_030507 [Idotea baltica]|nr:hypothetical protein [Idotea baltica]